MLGPQRHCFCAMRSGAGTVVEAVTVMDDQKQRRYSAYLPVAWEFREVIQEAIEMKKGGKIFFFNEAGVLDEVQGISVAIDEDKTAGEFLVTDQDARIRIDRIVTLYGKVGAAYEEYNAYADACMDCSGGEPQNEP